MMTLHEAIAQILSKKDAEMSTQEIANELNKRKLYIKRDGSLITDFQVHGRTRKYTNLFIRTGNKVGLIDNNKIAQKLLIKKIEGSKDENEASDMEIQNTNELFELDKFNDAGKIDELVPDKPGIYCFRLKSTNKLPESFEEEILSKKHSFIYIGIATQSLKKRMLNQELRAKGHGTFFRSIGATLGYLPPFNSLKDKKNKRNYKFSGEDEKAIISWLNNNVEVNWVELDSEINNTETQLIIKYQPVFNLDKNANKFGELSASRKRCVNFANGIR